MRTLGQFSLSHENNFDFLRFVLAIGVIYTHSYDLSGQPGELALQLTHQQLPISGMAVALFFVISGFLVTQSWNRSRGFSLYASKRVRRIMPGFVAAVLFCLLIVGPLSAPSIYRYLTDSTTYRFATLLCFKGPQEMLSVFIHNPLPFNMNGSLWTIRLELICYAVVAVFGFAGLLRNRWAATLFAGAGIFINFWLMDLRFMDSAPLIIKSSPALLLQFSIGMVFYVWRDVIRLSRSLAALCGLILVVSCYEGLRYTFPFCASYLLFYIAYSSTFQIHSFAKNRDLSYGVYLYAFPVQQLIVQLLPRIYPLVLWGFSSVITCGLAFLSWQFVEKPCLHRKLVSVRTGVAASDLSVV